MHKCRQAVRTRAAVWSGGGILCLALAPTAFAANIVQNPNIDSALAPFWAAQFSGAPDPVGSGAVVRNGSEDVTVNAASGSVQINVDATTTLVNEAVNVRQCVALSGGATAITEANYGARIKVPASVNPSDASIAAQVEIRFFSDAGCATFIPGTGGSQGRTFAAAVADNTFWYSAGDAHFVPPLGTVAASAEIRGTLRRASAGAATAQAYFDDFFLSLNGTTPIELQDFVVD